MVAPQQPKPDPEQQPAQLRFVAIGGPTPGRVFNTFAEVMEAVIDSVDASVDHDDVDPSGELTDMMNRWSARYGHDPRAVPFSMEEANRQAANLGLPPLPAIEDISLTQLERAMGDMRELMEHQLSEGWDGRSLSETSRASLIRILTSLSE